MKHLLTHILTIAILHLVTLQASAATTDPAGIPSPNIADSHNFVYDPGKLLSPRLTQDINHTLQTLRQTTTAEMAVAIIPDIPGSDFDYGMHLFTAWGLGAKDKDNGLLLIVGVNNHTARIITGYGLEGILPDARCIRILEQNFFPQARQGHIDTAIQDTVSTIVATLTHPQAADEIRSRTSQTITAPDIDMLHVVTWIAAIVWTLTAILFITQIITMRRRDRYHKALKWRENMPYYWLGGILSLGTALIFTLLAHILMRRTRTKTLRCRNCNHKMHRLSETEDNTRLTPSQDLEEQLRTVDYDVWECPQCSATEIFAYPQRQTKYLPCPKCGTVAYTLTHDITLTPATTRTQGRGRRTYECLNCGHQHHDDYTTPQKPDAAQMALAAGAVLGAMSGGRSHGGGSIGGGFGGGRSGGGGAGGRW